jgi:hypothetical protein
MIQEILVAIVVVTCAAYVAGRLLPGTLVERLLRRIDRAGPQLSRVARFFAGRPLNAIAAVPQGCSSCPATKDHKTRRA